MPPTNPAAKPPAKTVTAYGVLLRISSVLAAFFAVLMLLADLLDASSKGGDPIRILLTCSWGAAVLICAGATWRTAVQRGEG